MLPKLGPRLSLIASMVEKNARVCDVGTDHGLLPSYLFLKGEVCSVCATDINEAPLSRARQTVRRYGADGVELLLCDGLEEIDPSKCNTVIIAGMGGEVISGIIDRSNLVRSPGVTLLLQPMTGADELRLYLAQNGFEIICEPAVCEHGKVWSVIKAVFSGKACETDPLYLLIGKVSPKTEAGIKYIKKQYDRCLKCAESLKGVSGREEEFMYFNRITEEIKTILEEHYGI